MKRSILLLLVMAPILLMAGTDRDSCCVKEGRGRCTGSAVCSACTSCSSCKYCRAGGTCGVCAKKSNSQVFKQQSSNRMQAQKEVATGQCRAITRKGSRCSRHARSGGYCWQHGG